ncbi:thioesterase [Halogeometricum borinquense DSM 11551]|uniref:Thioesterase n=1 Tax=Halogeometricum borinquense (strain ATCC 700274 / DSM 11551 / JCM 10706 / KCTC 4070 / PR3) TaxID=469382 RepID=E4NTK9_HALBP|nr:thioesterase family protein [Halogeometricum borinquense]ADQ67061.1 predicted thioesterase [Halogeometricum borinquense DSM 11551]ELY29608.1 thioesterase [Halogeometricum borinquense DSM 11551]
MTEFAYESKLDVRFRDLDPVGHVNNAVYATYCEQARIDYFQDALKVEGSDVNTVLANVEINYRKPIEGLGELTIALGVSEVGNTSFEMEYELSFEDEVVATASSVQVVIDPETKEPAPIPNEWRERIENFDI